MNKYNKATIIIGGREVEIDKRVLVPKEMNGQFRTTDGARYARDNNGCIRRIAVGD